MKRKEKEKFISQVSVELKGKKNFFFTSFQGLKTEEINELRKHLDPLSWEYRVIKNTLYRRIFKNSELENFNYSFLDNFFQGPTALIFEKKGRTDPVEVSKTLSFFLKSHPNFRINAGFLAGRLLSQEEIINLAKLPSREVLLKQLVNQLHFPLVGLANVLQAPLRNLIYLLDQKSKKKF